MRIGAPMQLCLTSPSISVQCERRGSGRSFALLPPHVGLVDRLRLARWVAPNAQQATNVTCPGIGSKAAETPAKGVDGTVLHVVQGVAGRT